MALTGEIRVEEPARKPSLGLRAQILIGIACVTLFAVASAGLLALWAAGDGLREERETTGQTLASAFAAAAAATVDRQVPLDSLRNRLPLEALMRKVSDRSDLRGISILSRARVVVLAQPPRETDDADLQVAAAVLEGVGPVLHYRTDTGGISLLAYAPLEVQGAVLGAVRIALDAPAPVPGFMSRQGPLLALLALGDALLVALLGYLVLTRLVVRPLQDVERATARVSAGDLDQRIAPSGPREVAALASAFNQMTASLALQREQLIRTEKLASVGQLAAGVAHEIGNPLAAVLGYVDLLRTEDARALLAPDERRDILDRVKSETQRINRIIRDLLEYSRPGREETTAVDPREALASAVKLLEPQARFRGVTLRMLPADTPWPRALAPRGRLEQVFVNLLLNAADAMGAAGVITVTATTDEAGQVVITFADEGPGVPRNLARKIFDPFFTTKDPGHGTGLGLSISRAIVETCGGTLELVPTPEGERGARFALTLPPG